MEKYILYFLSIFCFLFIYSCSPEDDLLLNEVSEQQNENIILQQRGSNMPELQKLPLSVLNSKSKITARASGPNGEIIGNSEALLGFSYTVGNSIIGDMENVKFPILDIEKIKAEHPRNITAKKLNKSTSYSFTYNGMSRYEEKSQVTKVAKKGFSFNFGLFKLGRERKTKDIFKSNYSTASNMVFGELNIEIRNSQYELLCSSDRLLMYANEYLSPSFQTDLYRGTIGNIIDVYGPFVLRSYITGGKATALYAGRVIDETSTESIEGQLDNDINASFSWNSKTDSETTSGAVSGNLVFGKGNNSSSNREYKTKNTKISIQTYGGNPRFQAIAGTRELNSLSIDLSNWLSSLEDPNTHTIIDITSALPDKEEHCGLYPISDFVLEKNFKYRFDDTSIGILESFSDIQMPKIEIVKVYAKTTSTGEDLYEVAAVLTTRQGDKIVLSDGTYKTVSDDFLKGNNNKETMMSRVREIFAQKKTIFKDLDYTTNYNRIYNPQVRNSICCIRLDGFNEDEMSLYINPRTNMHYILNKNKKIALSYMYDEVYEDSVLDFYGIREWVESLPSYTGKMSMLLLKKYTIIGL